MRSVYRPFCAVHCVHAFKVQEFNAHDGQVVTYFILRSTSSPVKDGVLFVATSV